MVGAPLTPAVVHAVFVEGAGQTGFVGYDVLDSIIIKFDEDFAQRLAATDRNDCKASFSSYGAWVDISAPGLEILSSAHNHLDPAGDYVATWGGTSMASPLALSWLH